jgi:hypothetical protein
MPDAARALAEAGAAYAEEAEEGSRPNPALQGDAQDGTASRTGGDRDLPAEDQDPPVGGEAKGADGDSEAPTRIQPAAVDVEADRGEERED